MGNERESNLSSAFARIGEALKAVTSASPQHRVWRGLCDISTRGFTDFEKERTKVEKVEHNELLGLQTALIAPEAREEET
jgi:hypothetical protein